MSFENYVIPYEINERYKKKVAYFSMEFAIDQPLKIYSGGLGFLAGHLFPFGNIGDKHSCSYHMFHSASRFC